MMIYRNYVIFEDAISHTFRIMQCRDERAGGFESVDEAKSFIDELIEVESEAD